MLARLDELILAVESIPTTGSGASSESWRDGQCLTCVNWDEITPGVDGWCRRFPPMIENEEADGTQVTVQPRTQHDDTCSEYVTHVT